MLGRTSVAASLSVAVLVGGASYVRVRPSTPASDGLQVRYTCSPSALLSYAQDGHVTLPGLVPEAELRRVLPELLFIAEATWEEDTGFHRRSYNLWQKSAAARRLILSPRLASAAAQLLGVERVRVYFDQLLLKLPGARETPWHVDGANTPFDPPRTISLWLPLAPVPSRAHAPVVFASGTHARADVPTANRTRGSVSRWVQERKGELSLSEPARAFGEASMHSGALVHGARANRARTARPVLSIVYVPDGEPLTNEGYVRAVAERARAGWAGRLAGKYAVDAQWALGAAVGARARSPFLPLPLPQARPLAEASGDGFGGDAPAAESLPQVARRRFCCTTEAASRWACPRAESRAHADDGWRSWTASALAAARLCWAQGLIRGLEIVAHGAADRE